MQTRRCTSIVFFSRGGAGTESGRGAVRPWAFGPIAGLSSLTFQHVCVSFRCWCGRRPMPVIVPILPFRCLFVCPMWRTRTLIPMLSVSLVLYSRIPSDGAVVASLSTPGGRDARRFPFCRLLFVFAVFGSAGAVGCGRLGGIGLGWFSAPLRGAGGLGRLSPLCTVLGFCVRIGSSGHAVSLRV